MAQVQTKFEVGGILLDRPFKVWRLGHFGFNVDKLDECVRFYTELLGFRISDVLDFASVASEPDKLAGLGDTRGYFTRYGTDHHAFVIFNRKVMEAMAQDRQRHFAPEVTINQITWQVGSLSQVGNAINWFAERGIELQRSGRDMPGSNWHTYVYDPDGHTNELYYGIEQVGWDGYSKPRALYKRGFREAPSLPQVSEFEEVRQALAEGVDLLSGYRYQDPLPATYDVEGILLPRPFKITRIGPVNLFVRDVEAAKAFYQEIMGFTLTEAVEWQGHRCFFLRSNTEHHCLGLFPIALRQVLGLSDRTTCMSFGLQMANYRQLRDAVSFLRDHGVRVETGLIPPELYPGIDYAAFAFDPEGHCLMLYYYMEQLGWDGQPRPRELRRKVNPGEWPQTLEPLSDTYKGESFMGPWA
ncbi:MAG TPA: VOC family protein [Dehalococcoidia bacterium]|nr:VOC family protein [Dehalococcoidia bacterium]